VTVVKHRSGAASEHHLAEERASSRTDHDDASALRGGFAGQSGSNR
jgi:hypothetical protein